MNVCVFCSANEVDEKYIAPARELAELLGKDGHTLLWGGSDLGLMKVMADGVQEQGGALVGVTMELFAEYARPNADEMIIVESLTERKSLLLSRTDVIVVLVGGLGTLDELTEIIELKRHGRHDADILILNTDGFYEGLQRQLQRMSDEGFLPVAELGHEKSQGYSEWVQFLDEPAQIIEALRLTHPAQTALKSK